MNNKKVNLQPPPQPSEKTQGSQKPPVNYYHCPTCYRPYYYYDSSNEKKKKFLGLPIWAWVVVLIAVLFFACFIINFLFIFQPTEYKETYSTGVILADGGRFRYNLGYIWNDEDVSLDVRSREGEDL